MINALGFFVMAALSIIHIVVISQGNPPLITIVALGVNGVHALYFAIMLLKEDN